VAKPSLMTASAVFSVSISPTQVGEIETWRLYKILQPVQKTFVVQVGADL